MPKQVRRVRHRRVYKQPAMWLPIDQRLIPDIIRFGNVKGIARIFLLVEMTLTVIIVFSTLFLAILKLSGIIL